MEIDLPSIGEQQRIILEQSTREAISQLQQNLQAPVLPGVAELDESGYRNAHLLREREGWAPPAADLVAAYFRHFQDHFPAYGTDRALAGLLGVSSDRRIREFKSGQRSVPYGVWRRFLVMTGRAPQEIIPVMAIVERDK